MDLPQGHIAAEVIELAPSPNAVTGRGEDGTTVPPVKSTREAGETSVRLGDLEGSVYAGSVRGLQHGFYSPLTPSTVATPPTLATPGQGPGHPGAAAQAASDRWLVELRYQHAGAAAPAPYVTATGSRSEESRPPSHSQPDMRGHWFQAQQLVEPGAGVTRRAPATSGNKPPARLTSVANANKFRRRRTASVSVHRHRLARARGAQ